MEHMELVIVAHILCILSLHDFSCIYIKKIHRILSPEIRFALFSIIQRDFSFNTYPVPIAPPLDVI
jgi:hypothetical protein